MKVVESLTGEGICQGMGQWNRAGWQERLCVGIRGCEAEGHEGFTVELLECYLIFHEFEKCVWESGMRGG